MLLDDLQILILVVLICAIVSLIIGLIKKVELTYSLSLMLAGGIFGWTVFYGIKIILFFFLGKHKIQLIPEDYFLNIVLGSLLLIVASAYVLYKGIGFKDLIEYQHLKVKDKKFIPHKMSSRTKKALEFRFRDLINQICRNLKNEGKISRINSVCNICKNTKILNFIDISPNEKSMDVVQTNVFTTHTPDDKWTYENEWFEETNISRKIRDYLKETGHDIIRFNDDKRQKGHDIITAKNGIKTIIEVKGYPSKYYVGTEKQGQKKPTHPNLQAKHWFSEALLSFC